MRARRRRFRASWRPSSSSFASSFARFCFGERIGAQGPERPRRPVRQDEATPRRRARRSTAAPAAVRLDPGDLGRRGLGQPLNLRVEERVLARAVAVGSSLVQRRFRGATSAPVVRARARRRAPPVALFARCLARTRARALSPERPRTGATERFGSSVWAEPTWSSPRLSSGPPRVVAHQPGAPRCSSRAASAREASAVARSPARRRLQAMDASTTRAIKTVIRGAAEPRLGRGRGAARAARVARALVPAAATAAPPRASPPFRKTPAPPSSPCRARRPSGRIGQVPLTEGDELVLQLADAAASSFWSPRRAAAAAAVGKAAAAARRSCASRSELQGSWRIVSFSVARAATSSRALALGRRRASRGV